MKEHIKHCENVLLLLKILLVQTTATRIMSLINCYCFLLQAVMEENPDHLVSMLISIPGSQPIRSRILDMWSYWKDGLRFMQKNKGNIDTRSKKKVSAVMPVFVLFSN